MAIKVIYPEINQEGEAKSEIFFLKNHHLWFFFSPKRKSRYFGGFFFLNNQALRFFDELEFFQKIKEAYLLSPEEIILYLENNQAYLHLTEDSLEITFANWQEIKISFDIKDIFKNEPEKRNLQIKRISSSCLLVEEFLEGGGILKILIDADVPLEFKQEWIKKEMDFDQKRNSPPYEWWVFDGIYGKAREIKIKIVYPEIKQEKNQFVLSPQEKFLNFLLQRINALILDNYLPAGFPWFYENWYRDELFSLFLIKEFLNEKFFNQRVDFYLTNLENIWDQNKPGSSFISADNFFWFILNLDETRFFTHFQILEKFLVFWKNKFIKDRELNLPPRSTWMDTLERKTALEIIALYLKTLRRFVNYNKFYQEEINFWQKVLKEKIVENKSDINLIFCFLLLEDLYSFNTWEKIFDELLKENYLEWGGLSTISKNNPRFLDEEDGERGKAYHSGDSWYYLNNLLAYCLMKINPKKYERIIKKIFESSKEDLLFDGALGWSSEISSAKERKSEGALVQLWSMASFIFAFLKSGYLSQIFPQSP